MNILSRIFRGEHRELGAPESYIEQAGPDGSYRVRRVPDTSMNAIAARWNAGMIYGHQNLPPQFGTRRVIEVPDPNNPGQWVPVTGSRMAVPEFDAQLAALMSYRETGVIGPAAVNPEGSMGLAEMPIVDDGAGLALEGSGAADAITITGSGTGIGSMFSNWMEGMNNAMFPSGRWNNFELSEFIDANPWIVAPHGNRQADSALDPSAALGDGVNRQAAPATPDTAMDDAIDFMQDEDAAIAQEQQAAGVIDMDASKGALQDEALIAADIERYGRVRDETRLLIERLREADAAAVRTN